MTLSPRKSKWSWTKYIDVFDTKLRKSMNVEPVQLNVREGSQMYAYFSCMPTLTLYRVTGRKLEQDLFY